MRKFRSSPFIFISIFISIVFYFDLKLMIGTDNSWYLDMAYALNSNLKFLKDFYDYRFPVFSYFLSFLYNFKLNDSANIYIVLTLVYGTYTILIYKLSILITKSRKYAVFVSIITFLSISSRDFDVQRNICQPLFHHILELTSIYFIWIVFNSKDVIKNRNHIFLIVLAGIFSMSGFMGRQVQIFPFILITYFVFQHIISPIKSNNNFIKYLFLYFFGVILSGIVLFYIFYLPSQYYYNLNEWLFKIPLNIHTNSMIPYQFARRIIGIILSIFGYYIGIYNPIIYTTSIFFIYIFLSNITTLSNVSTFIKTNKRFLILLLFIILSHLTSTIFTGAGVPRYQSSVFTIFAISLSLLLTKFNYINNLILKFLFIIFIYFSYLFFKTEFKSYKISENQPNNHLFNNIIAEELKKNIVIENNNRIMVLGGQSIVGRIAEYKPFMGHFSDVTLFSQAKFEKKKFEDLLKIKIKEIDIIYKLPDYPNLEFVGEDSTNSTFILIENELNDNFYLKTIIKPINSHPYDYKKGAEIYIRKN
jgi:hypothetical protein